MDHKYHAFPFRKPIFFSIAIGTIRKIFYLRNKPAIRYLQENVGVGISVDDGLL